MDLINVTHEDRMGLTSSMEGLSVEMGPVSPSMESFLNMDDIKLTTPSELVSFRKAHFSILQKKFEESNLCGCCDDEPSIVGTDSSECGCRGKKKEKEKLIVEAESPNEYNIFIDDERFFIMSMAEYFSLFSNMVSDIHKLHFDENTVVNIYTDLNYVNSLDLLYFGCNVLNLLDLIPGKKVFQINCLCDLTGLIFARKCDKLAVGSMAAININSGYSDNYLSGVLKEAYETFLNEVFDDWKQRGLLTEDEVTSFFTTSAKVDIFLSAEEIKSRLGQ